MKTHKLKIQDRFYEAIEAGFKTFEVRKDDRGFKRGDFVEFTTLDGKPREGRWLIDYKLTHEDFPDGVPEGYCVFGLKAFLGCISDSRLFEIINGKAGPTDAEIAEIVRSAVHHCRKTEPNGHVLAIRQAAQGSTWWNAFKALFDGMGEEAQWAS